MAGVLLVACTEKPDEPRGIAPAAAVEQIETEDGVTLDARYWHMGATRVAIFLHEFRDDQDSWWPHARRYSSSNLSTLAFDFRGHGASEGEPDDVEGMLLDLRAAIEFVRARGHQEIMLVGAGMGAAVAIMVAAEQENMPVIGLSTPAEFDVLEPVAVVEPLRSRIALVASRDDLSAEHSMGLFREAGVPAGRSRVLPGRSHGVRMLEGRAGADLRAYLDRMLRDIWTAI